MKLLTHTDETVDTYRGHTALPHLLSLSTEIFEVLLQRRVLLSQVVSACHKSNNRTLFDVTKLDVTISNTLL